MNRYADQDKLAELKAKPSSAYAGSIYNERQKRCNYIHR